MPAFWQKVNRGSTDQCWDWTASTNGRGYGEFGFGGKKYLAHRFSFELANGPIKKGLFVCHRCDNPSCVNPAHLFLGTQKDNMMDMAKKGRREWDMTHLRGEKHPLSKLTKDDVLAIRRDGRGHKAVAADYGVSPTLIRNVRNRETWAHV